MYDNCRMPSIPSLVRHRFRRITPGAKGLRASSGPGVAMLMERVAGEDRILEVIATGDNVDGVAADLVASHLKAYPGLDIHAEAALIPDSAERDRAVRELIPLCEQHRAPL